MLRLMRKQKEKVAPNSDSSNAPNNPTKHLQLFQNKIYVLKIQLLGILMLIIQNVVIGYWSWL